MYFNKLNSFQAEGRLTNEPITNFSEKGNLVTTIRVAVKTPYVLEGENQTAFVSFTAVDSEKNKIATNLAEFLTTGSPVYIEGYFDSYSDYDKEETNKINYHEIKRISKFSCLESKTKTEERKEKNSKKAKF